MEQNENQNCPMSVLCRNGCGFYGNSAFDGMCSKCYKDALKRKNNSTSPEQQATGRISPATLTAPLKMTTSSIETALPTVPSTSSYLEKDEEKIVGAEAKVDGATGETDTSSIDSSQSNDKKPKKNRCTTCKKKVGLTGFQCRCGGLYCSLHRYSDKHECQFDYQKLGADEIRKNNPVVVSVKIQKI